MLFFPMVYLHVEEYRKKNRLKSEIILAQVSFVLGIFFNIFFFTFVPTGSENIH